MARRTKEQPMVAAKRDPGEIEQAHIQAATDRWRQRAKDRAPVRVAASTSPAGILNIESPHSSADGWTSRICDAFGSISTDFVFSQIAALEWAGRERGQVASEGTGVAHLNSALAIVEAVKPENEVEAALAVQLAGNHALTMEMMGRAKSTENLHKIQLYGNLAVKLQRTFAAQVEALAKLRRGGEQVVKHVHVYEGGQAVVAGTINSGGRGVGSEKRGQSHAQIGAAADAPFAAMPGPHAQGERVPVASDAERSLPDARRHESGGAEGEQERAQARRLHGCGEG